MKNGGMKDDVSRRDAVRMGGLAAMGMLLGGAAVPAGEAHAAHAAAAVGYQVIYNLNGGANPGGQPLWVAKGDALRVRDLLVPVRAGYTFAGWYADQKLTKKATLVMGKKAKKGRTLYAKWNLVTYKIDYDLAGGAQAAGQRSSYTVETPSFALKAPAKPRFSFSGWFADAGCAEAVDIVTRGSTGDLKVYAKWEPLPEEAGLPSGILELNPGIGAMMHQAKRRLNIGYNTQEGRPPILTLLHFSDIHGHAENLSRLQEFRNHYSEFIDDVIHTGDMVAGRYADGTSFWESSCDGSFLTCIGNHDVWIEGGASSSLISQREAHDAYIAPWVGKWGDVSWQDGRTYYYKDYPENLIRLIVLDCMLSGSEAAEQDSWLSKTLEDARVIGYSVVCAEHYHPALIKKVECTFTSVYRGSAGELDQRYQRSVQRFVDGGGDFCCWLAGHTHYDLVVYSGNYPEQLFLVVTTAQVESVWEDAARIPGDKSQDAFNLVSFDTSAHVVKVVRVGQDRDHLMRHMGTLVLDYKTCEVVYND